MTKLIDGYYSGYSYIAIYEEDGIQKTMEFANDMDANEYFRSKRLIVESTEKKRKKRTVKRKSWYTIY